MYRCWHDYSDRCRVNEATRINFEEGCYESNSSGQNYTEIERCVESEWLAEDAYGQTVIMNGCLNDPPPGSRTISNPSETVLSAVATSCGEIFQERTEACSKLSVDDCLDEGEGCKSRVEDVIGACVLTTEDESKCPPTCDLAEPECAENEVRQPLLRRTSDGVIETVDVCVP